VCNLIDTFSCLVGVEVMHQTVVRKVLGLIFDSGKDFHVNSFVLLLFNCLYLFVQNTLRVMQFCNSFFNVISIT